MKMKIAIPTNDMIRISKSISSAGHFRVFDVSSYGIINEEFRTNGKTNEETLQILHDCNIIFTTGNDTSLEKKLTETNHTLVKTETNIITNTIVAYVNDLIYKESNTCCCP